MSLRPHFGPCPLPIQHYPQVLMAHGSGGRMMHHLIEQMFLATFGNEQTGHHDAACLDLSHPHIAFTTDSYVVSPIFFPGGDIGRMAIYGTVNDLAMAGARPLYLSLSFILEEGLSMETLWQVVQSIRFAANQAQVAIVTGDTKVVERGKCDGLYINTSGIGSIEHAWDISPASIRAGDAILINGDLGRHAIAIMAQREGLAFETTLESDLAPLARAVLALIEAGVEIHCLRDLTRGGLATALNELAQAAHCLVQLGETIPVSESVAGASEILGLDPLYLANEGRFVAFLPPSQVQRAIAILQAVDPDSTPQQIGVVEADLPPSPPPFWVKMHTPFGGNRILDYRNVDGLPRIC
ncbi:hydrogenase expression/formation protein HypE [Lyngbya confervoides]|uniref:Hydrogenase expression/formation protein HypE n=1 Tax=Lyngbya confervoides BDU141951 TaxID=1574623 RepID=A0ABD4SYL7_9CYAN|nr:hydrogenase expression/formation protein HypE [Lyngbya confervoides]MCM1981453.1 hydrogenase expression/formation protein HypE [Lyngbya confervoides BDU141951]